MNIIYTNADCLTNKRNELLLLINSMECKPDIIIITEVNSKVAKNKMQESEFHIDGFVLFSTNVGALQSRGIIMFVNNLVPCTHANICTKFEECLFVKIHGSSGNNLLIGVFYRSPNSLPDNDRNLYNDLDKLRSDFCGKILLIGDFNFPGINWSNWTSSCVNFNSSEKLFLAILQKFFWIQHVDKPTRARGSDKSNILDLIITNEEFIENLCYLSPLGC
ncbi:MAG: hypothetical protein ACHQ1D_13755, partial [Nitrososphaerales archaeon]